MDRLWDLLKKIKTSKTTYKSHYHKISSSGNFVVEVVENINKIYFSERGRVEIDDGTTLEANNYIYWKKTNSGIEFHRRRMGGYEKLFEIGENGNSIKPHT